MIYRWGNFSVDVITYYIPIHLWFLRDELSQLSRSKMNRRRWSSGEFVFHGCSDHLARPLLALAPQTTTDERHLFIYSHTAAQSRYVLIDRRLLSRVLIISTFLLRLDIISLSLSISCLLRSSSLNPPRNFFTHTIFNVKVWFEYELIDLQYKRGGDGKNKFFGSPSGFLLLRPVSLIHLRTIFSLNLCARSMDQHTTR